MSAITDDIRWRLIAQDAASAVLNKVGGSVLNFGGMLKKAALMAGAYFSGREIIRFARESLDAFAEAEKSLQNLADALGNLGKGKEDLKVLVDYSMELQKMGIVSEDTAKQMMFLGITVGHLSGEKLKAAVKAAIGLAAAYKKELPEAMMLVSKAASGNTATLSKFGIKLADNLTPAQKFNEILKIGAENFKIAEGETNLYGRSVERLKWTWDELKESIGGVLAPVFKKFFDDTRKWIEEHTETITHWVYNAVQGALLVKDVFVSFVEFMRTDWKTGLDFALNGSLTIFKGFAQSVMNIMEKLFTDIGMNPAVWLKRATMMGVAKIAENVLRDKLAKEILDKKYGHERLPRLTPRTYPREEVDAAREEAFRQMKATGATAHDQWENIKKQYPIQETESWKSILDKNTAIMKQSLIDFGKLVPGKLKEAWEKDKADWEARLAKYQISPLPSANKTPKPAGEEAASTAVRQALAPMEAGFLTFAPGSQIDVQQELVQQGKQQTTVLASAGKTLDLMLQELKRMTLFFGGVKPEFIKPGIF